MFESIYKDLRYRIQTGGFWIRCIVICIAVFLVINLIRAYFTFVNDGFPGAIYFDIIHHISLSSEIMKDLIFPWVWLTHVFLHESFFHLLWNMLWLFWLGAIVEDLIGKRHAQLIFFESAIFGGIFFIISTHLLPWYYGLEIHAYGASAAVCGLLFAAATISPKYEVKLFLIGDVQIKYIALVVLILDLLFAGENSNSGGHFAHLGGAFWGWAYISMLRKGIAMDAWLNIFNKSDSKKQRNFSNSGFQKKQQRKDPVIPKEEKLNKILDKIKNNGIESLNSEEKEFLDHLSQE
jgi:membrane associated rhomboid family serine protease